jgi:hypothetical protein
MFSVLWAILTGTVSCITEWAWGFVLGHKSPAQEAIDTETKMGQDIADEPDQAGAVEKLEHDDV